MNNIQVPSGLLLVNKPTDWTSFDAVNKVRHTIAKELNLKPKRVKVGHSGTLDPKATGLLVLAIGKATKQIERLAKQDKSYEVGAVLGVTSTTGDSEGDLTENMPARHPKDGEVTEVLKSFMGEIKQTPHRFSAIKVDGVRAYKLARQGKEVELKQRKVIIHHITNVMYEWPRLNFDAKVSSGTYIRSLVEDIGEKLGVGAYMSSLRRTEIGDYKLENATEVEELDYKKVIQTLLPLD